MDQSLSKLCAQKIAECMAACLSLDAATTIQQLNACAAELCQHSDCDDEHVEIKRRSTEAIISLTYQKAEPDLFWQVWSEMENLGFSNEERELSMLFYCISFCDHTVESTLAVKYLNRFKTLANVVNEPMKSHFLDVYQRLAK